MGTRETARLRGRGVGPFSNALTETSVLGGNDLNCGHRRGGDGVQPLLLVPVADLERPTDSASGRFDWPRTSLFLIPGPRTFLVRRPAATYSASAARVGPCFRDRRGMDRRAHRLSGVRPASVPFWGGTRPLRPSLRDLRALPGRDHSRRRKAWPARACKAASGAGRSVAIGGGGSIPCRRRPARSPL